jgi:hypothetical protein
LVGAELYHQLQLCQAAIDPDKQERPFDLITVTHFDFTERGGAEVRCFSYTLRAKRNRPSGIPTYSFWPMTSDPRSKKKLSKLSTEVDRNLMS